MNEGTSEYKDQYEELQLLMSNDIEDYKLYLVREVSSSTFRMAKKTTIYSCSDNSHELILNEVKMLKDLKNPHVLKYYDVFLEEEEFVVILEFCEEGDLDHYIKKRRERKDHFSEKLILSWVMQILMALEYIHNRNIIHRLVNAQNIYLNHQGDVKLGSFGAAKILENTLEKAMTIVGLPCNLSPEMVEGKPYDSKADIWTLGCLIYELATFQHPFQVNNLPELYDLIVKNSPVDLPIKYSKYLNPLYKKMMKKNPNFRPSATELLQQEVFIKIMKQYTRKKKIDSLDLRELTPKQLLIHKKKNGKLTLPPIAQTKGNFQMKSTSSSMKKKQGEAPLSRSRQKVVNVKPQLSETVKTEKTPKSNKQTPTKSPPTPSKMKQMPKEAEEKSSPQKQKLLLKTPQKEQKLENSHEISEEIQEYRSGRITVPNLEEGEYISILYQIKLELLQKRYSPKMEQIFEQTIEFQE